MDEKKWRTDSTLFRRDAKLAGTVNLSPAWFQQGHSQFMFQHPLEASTLLKPGRNEEEAKQWLAMMFKAHSHISAAMGVMHPQMYAIGHDTLIKIWEDASAEIREVLRVWPSVYSSLSLMVNR
ncbi:hypothetical protein PAXRUDRAFT_181645, partial [Paxillus rubicundulus Ve08.2h10]